MKDYNDLGVLPQNDSPKRTGDFFTSCCSWFLQIFVLISLTGGLVYHYLHPEQLESLIDYCLLYFPFFFFYFLYFGMEICSPTFHYLSSQKDSSKIYTVMGKLLNTDPVLGFTAQCYHYEYRTYTETDSKGNTQEKTEKIRVNTHYETEEFKYYSFRDVSGTFLLDVDKAAMKKKAYIKLYLSKNIEFADAISIADYKKQKNEFYDRNVDRDTHLDFNEYEDLPGLQNINLVKLGSYEPCCFGKCAYVFYTIIMLAQFY